MATPLFITLYKIIYFLLTSSLLFTFFYILKKKERVVQTISFTFYAAISFALGFCVSIYSLSWIHTAYPLYKSSLGILQMLLFFVAHFLFCFVSGVSFLTIAFFLYFTKKYTGGKKIVRFVLLPFIFSYAEMLRAFFLTASLYGSESSLAMHYAIGEIGNSIGFTPFLPLSYFGGGFFLTYFFVAMIVLLCFHESRKQSLILFISPLLCASLIVLSIPPKSTEKNVSILLVATEKNKEYSDIPMYEKENDLLLKRIYSFATTSPLIIALPEDARFITFLTDTQKESIQKLFPHSLFISGETIPYGKTFRNMSVYYDVEQDVAVGRSKIALAPFTEYAPSLLTFLSSLLLPSGENIQKEHYTRGGDILTISFDHIIIASLICSEVYSWNVVNAIQKEKPNILFVQVSLTAFHHNKLYYAAFVSTAQVVAATIHTPLFISSNNGPLVYINERGEIEKYSEDGLLEIRH